jgi:hypothetical protein
MKFPQMDISTEPEGTNLAMISTRPGTRSWGNVQFWLIAAFLLVLPSTVYWNTIWAHYGLRDDYAVVREARVEPAQIMRFCGSHARPVYAWLLQKSFKHIDHIRDLSLARLMGSVTLGLVSVAVFAMLVTLYRWPLLKSVSVAALMVLVPSAQVIASWGILWPYNVAVLLSLGAFALAELAFRKPPEQRATQYGLVGLASVLMVASAWTYQSCSLFYLVFVAVAVVRRGEWALQGTRLRLIQHMLLLAASLLVAYVLIRVVFAVGLLPMSKRIAFDTDPLGKLVWFAKNALPNALALPVLNDLQGRTAVVHHLMATLVGVVIVGGGIATGLRRGWGEGLVWFVGFIVLALGSYVVNFVASERWFSYRTIYPLTGVIIVFLAAAMAMVAEIIPAFNRIRLGLGVALLVVAAYLARSQTYELIAVPQNRECRLVEQESQKLDRARDQKVYVITPTPALAPARLMCTDEFGSLSTDSDWVPKEILKLYFHDQYPDQPRCISLDHMVSGEKPPPPGIYDVVLDLRGLRELRSPTPGS